MESVLGFRATGKLSGALVKNVIDVGGSVPGSLGETLVRANALRGWRLRVHISDQQIESRAVPVGKSQTSQAGSKRS